MMRLSYLQGKLADPVQAPWAARVPFLQVAQEENPKFLPSLHALLPHWERSGASMYLKLGDASVVHRHILRAEEGTKFYSLRRALEVWAKEWNLAYEWVLEAALDTLEAWHAGGTKKEDAVVWHVRFRSFSRPLRVALDPLHPNPLVEMPDDAERRLMARGVPRQEVRRAYKAQEQRLLDAGFMPARMLYDAKMPFQEKLRGTVWRVVGKKTHTEIEKDVWDRSRRSAPDPPNISREVRTVAKLIGIELPDGRGRPRRR